MERPEDYNTYFNEDGAKKECPFDFKDETKQFDAIRWYKRQSRITFDLMTKEEQTHFLERCDYYNGQFLI